MRFLQPISKLVLILGASGWLAACGGGGGGGNVPDELTVLGVELSFPTPNANHGGGAVDTLVAGRIPVAVAPRGITAADINFVDVNGLLATLDPADPSRWSARVPLTGDVTAIAVTLDLTNGQSFNANGSVANVVTLPGPRGIALVGGTFPYALVIDLQLRALIAIDLASGVRTIISDDDTGSGFFVSPVALVHDAPNNRVLVADAGRTSVLAVNLDNGDKTILSSLGTGTGPLLIGISSIALNAAGDGVFVGTHFGVLFQIDLATGDRSILSDAGTGIGTDFVSIEGVALDAANNRVLVIDFTAGLFTVDLANGNRSVIFTAFSGPFGVALDTTKNRALVPNFFIHRLDAIDLNLGPKFGTREVLTSPSMGTGPRYNFPRAVAYDAATNRAMIVAESFRGLMAVDLSSASGNRAVISDAGTGSGENIGRSIGKIALDTANNRVLAQMNLGTMDVDLGSGDRTLLTTWPFLMGAGAFVLDKTSNRALIIDGLSDELHAIDLANGNGTVISSAGTLPSLAGSGSMVLDEANNRVLVAHPGLNALLAVNLNNGNRSVISDAVTGTGLNLTSPSGVALDTANNRVLVTDTNFAAPTMFAIDLTTGDRTVLSDVGTGIGPNLTFPGSIALDASNDRVLVTDSNRLLAIDLTNGNRSEISGPGVGTGLGLLSPGSVQLDLPNHRAFVADANLRALFVIDLDSGDRAIVSQ